MSTDVWTKNYIKDLTEKELDHFQEIVISDVKNNSSSEEKTILANNLELWLYCLQLTRREVELKLSRFKTALKAKIKEKNDQGASQEEITDFRIVEETWRNNAVRFLNAIEKKVLYVKLLIDEEEIIED